MDIVDKIVEARIQEALEKGELSKLPGTIHLKNHDFIAAPGMVGARNLIRHPAFVEASISLGIIR